MHISYIMVSNTKMGPVGPRIVSGCPDRKPNTTPTKHPPKRVSITEILFPVAPAKSPPNVISGANTATYRKMKEARHWKLRASTKSDLYLKTR